MNNSMDAMQRLAFEADGGVMAVLGRGESYLLVDLDAPLPQEVMDDAARRGYAFCGVLGIIGGKATAKCERDPQAACTMLHAALGFVALTADRLRSKPKDGFAAWMQRIMELPDARG